jgi:signal transduction histidine kinase
MELIQVVEEVVGQFDAAAKAKGDPWLVDVPGEALVQADPSLVSSALQALVDNAVKHGSRGLIRITARPGDDGPAGMWILAVGDAGPGIEPLRLGILMDPVKRMEMKERGLGLSTAHYAVQLCGGRLEASSRPGEGSSFRLILPRVDR